VVAEFIVAIIVVVAELNVPRLDVHNIAHRTGTLAFSHTRSLLWLQSLSTLDLSYNSLDAQATLGPSSPLSNLPAWVRFSCRQNCEVKCRFSLKCSLTYPLSNLLAHCPTCQRECALPVGKTVKWNVDLVLKCSLTYPLSNLPAWVRLTCRQKCVKWNVD